ncbi:MAG: glycerate kinase [Rudaea sp.]|uniref:glycerate kinase n=1 Tax=Rudaea sp. TaxID=2136325 RepID=UPI0039E4CEF9
MTTSALRVLVMPDKFKGTLTSAQAARAIVRGLKRAWPHAHFTTQALADGGEGFARALLSATGGAWRRARTTDAAGRACVAGWGLLGDGATAVLDLAAASGLAQLPPALRDASRTSTFGSGVLIRRALAAGAKRIVVGLGGSATNEGGVGLASALGWKFLDRHGEAIDSNGAGLLQLQRIVAPKPRPRVRILAACDVDNPLFGRRGAAFQFAPQKGADAPTVRTLDRALRRLARIVERDLGVDLARIPGAGAAGGCGFGLMAFCGARLDSGFDILRHEIGLDALVRAHDLVVTGEGAFDATSLDGKAPYRLAQLARVHRVPAWGLFGRIDVATAKLPFERAAALVAGDAALPASIDAAEHARRLEAAACDLAARA